MGAFVLFLILEMFNPFVSKYDVSCCWHLSFKVKWLMVRVCYLWFYHYKCNSEIWDLREREKERVCFTWWGSISVFSLKPLCIKKQYNFLFFLGNITQTYFILWFLCNWFLSRWQISGLFYVVIMRYAMSEYYNGFHCLLKVFLFYIC